MDPNSPEATSYILIIVLAAVVFGIIAKPAIALIILGILALIGGLFSIASGGIFGVSFGTTGIVSGVALIGFGRLIAFVESLLEETRLLRKDIARLRSTPVEVLDPMEAELRREISSSPKRGK